MPDRDALVQAIMQAQAGTGPGIGNRPTVRGPDQDLEALLGSYAVAPRGMSYVGKVQGPPTAEGREPYQPEEAGEGPQPSDEETLETVRQGMGGGSPPPQSGMQWVDVKKDLAALEADPSPENVKAFADYWGPDEIPTDSPAMDVYRQGVDESQRPR